jgi:hypothetical protein
VAAPGVEYCAESLSVVTIDPVFSTVGIAESCDGAEGVDKRLVGEPAVRGLGKLKEVVVP